MSEISQPKIDLSIDTKAESYKEMLIGLNIRVASEDFTRPWGGFFVIDKDDTVSFIAKFFPEADILDNGNEVQKLSPKILFVLPSARLSWQYHKRRSELWRVLEGPVGITTSDSDEQGSVQISQGGESLTFGAEVRHRLIGMSAIGVIAEIWEHTDPNNPSDEQDIIRLEDDYSR